MGIFEIVRDVDICEKCGEEVMWCKNSRNASGIRKRSKICRNCGNTITTVEIDERDIEEINRKYTEMAAGYENLIGIIKDIERLVDDGK